MTPYQTVAVNFASNLAEGHYLRAWHLLVPELQKISSADVLRREFEAMFEGVSASFPRRVVFDDEHTLHDWPGKHSDDVAWVYLSVVANNVVEAVSVIVTQRDSGLLIRHIEWRRP